MPSKDFKVKNGLEVAQNIVVRGSLQSINPDGSVSTIIDSSGGISAAGSGFDSAGVLDIVQANSLDSAKGIPLARSSISLGSAGSHSYDSATGILTVPGTTDHITEGSNLFYTDARADARAQLKIDNLVDAAPGTLDTLNELAAALGDDANFSTTVTNSIATKLPTITVVTVTVASGTNQYGSGNKYHFNGAISPVLHLQPGRTYRFDQSDSSNSGHPLRFSSNANNSPSATYSTGVTVSGTPGSSGAYTEIVVNFATPRLHYYCTSHSGMGGSGPTVSAFSGVFADLTSKPTTIAGYGITDAFDGAYGSLTGVPSTFAPSAHNQAWSTITSTPTTISGYGITDAQATLVSGTNIKTINNNSLLGSGNITISGGSGGGTDSATVSAIILSDVDSAYVQARQTSGGGGGGAVDSAQTISLITDTVDSSYISARSGFGVTNAIFNDFKFIADSGQTAFTGADANSNTLSFDDSNFTVFINGIRLLKSDYTFNSSTNTLTLDSAASLEDEVVINTVTSPNITTIIDNDYIAARLPTSQVFDGMRHFEYTTGSNQTLFSGADSNGNALVFTSNNIQVFLNGIALAPSDYTLNDAANSITLAQAAPTGSELRASIINVADAAAERFKAWTEVNSTTTLSAKERRIVDTSGGPVQLNLPAVVTLGDEVRIVDGTGNAGTNNITINRNGHKIEGDASNLVIDLDRAGFGLVYYNTAQGWIITER